MWTAPVPVSMVTNSAVKTMAVRGRKGCCAPMPSSLSPGKDSIGSPVGWKPVAAQNCGTSLSARTRVSVVAAAPSPLGSLGGAPAALGPEPGGEGAADTPGDGGVAAT